MYTKGSQRWLPFAFVRRRAPATSIDPSSAPLNLLPRFPIPNRDADALDFRAAGRIFHLDGDGIDAGEVGLRLVKGDEAGDLEGQALLVVCGGHLAALDVDGAVRGRREQPDRGQGSAGAIGQHVEVDADLDVLSRLPLGGTLDRGFVLGKGQ